MKQTRSRDEQTIATWSARLELWQDNLLDSQCPFLNPPASEFFLIGRVGKYCLDLSIVVQILADVRRQIADEEEDTDNVADDLSPELSPSAFIILGIELKEAM